MKKEKHNCVLLIDVCEGGLKEGTNMRNIINLEVHEAHGLQTEISVHLP